MSAGEINGYGVASGALVGTISDSGLIYAQNVMPAITLGDSASAWGGKLGAFLRV